MTSKAPVLLRAHPHKPSQLTISLGAASFPRDAQSKSDLLEAADVALYEAKHSGRNMVILHSELNLRQGLRREQRLNWLSPFAYGAWTLMASLFEHQAMTVDITTTGARIGRHRSSAPKRLYCRYSTRNQ